MRPHLLQAVLLHVAGDAPGAALGRDGVVLVIRRRDDGRADRRRAGRGEQQAAAERGRDGRRHGVAQLGGARGREWLASGQGSARVP